MKRLFYSFLAILLLLSTFKSGAINNDKPFVIPELQEWTGNEGMFIPTSTSRIILTGTDPEIHRIANKFACDYETMYGHQMEVLHDLPVAGDFVFSLSSDKELGEEGYTLEITDRVVLSAYKSRGLFWGTRTILQMTEHQADYSLPKGKARDYPDYAVRGFMLDCGRKFFPLSFLYDYIEMMAYYKINTFQIHLNDNGLKRFYEQDWNKTYAAFRLECDTYPGLTARDGFYTKKEFIELQQFAEQMGVEIIPEIDVPAHSLSFTQYKPELASEDFEMSYLDLFNPEVYTFLDALFTEYLEGENPVFRGNRVHIGSDEYATKDEKVLDKFREFIDHYIRYVESFGKQACMWGSLSYAKGKTPVKSENVILNIWFNGFAEPDEMIKQGYQLITIPDTRLYIVPAAGYYHDYLNTEDLYNTWTPAVIGGKRFPEKHKQILGGMFAVWNDHIQNGISTKDIHYRALPAMQTLAVKMWTGKKHSLSYDTFNVLRLSVSEGPGINVAGRMGKASQSVYKLDKLTPGMTTGLKEIGYEYTVSFDIQAEKENRGTLLLSSPEAEFYLSDPVSGKLGFVRDGYLNTFNYQFYPKEPARVSICGDETSTRLYINGQLKEDLHIQKRYYNAGKDSTNYVRTLVFPLEKAGCFRSTITNLEVLNYCEK